MTEYTTGTVLAVNVAPQGSALAADVALGATQIVVEDAADFLVSGHLTLGAEILPFTAVDDVTGTITLGAPTAAAYTAFETPVHVYSLTTASAVSEVVAQVQALGDPDGGDALEATVDHALIPFLPEGIREPDLGESVLLQEKGGELHVVDLLGLRPRLDGSHIVAGSVTAGKIAAGSITATELAAGSVTAAKIDADAINGKTITGATIRTAETGDRVQMDTTNGILFFGSSHSAAGKIDVVGGALSVQSPRTSATLQRAGRLIFEPTGLTAPGTVRLYSNLVIDDDGTTGGAGSIQFLNGTKLRRADFGSGTFTTDASSQVTITHALGATPTTALLTPGQSHQLRRFSKNGSVVVVEVRSTTGALVGSGVSVPVEWLVLA